MSLETPENVRLATRPGGCVVTMNRPHHRNAFTGATLRELHSALDRVEADESARWLMLEGAASSGEEDQPFCSGLDFSEVARRVDEGTFRPDGEAELYASLLRRFALSSRFVIARVEGPAMAGGVGFAAAADFVVATSRASFALPEAIWGLVAANVVPYLIRRCGFQRTYLMALLGSRISAAEAQKAGLVDELTDNPESVVRQVALRISRLKPATIAATKRFFREMWIIDTQRESEAIRTIQERMSDPSCVAAIKAFVDHGKFPWE